MYACKGYIPIYHSCYSNESLIFKIKNQCNAIEIHYKAKPVIQNKERAKIETKSSYKKEDDKIETKSTKICVKIQFLE